MDLKNTICKSMKFADGTYTVVFSVSSPTYSTAYLLVKLLGG